MAAASWLAACGADEAGTATDRGSTTSSAPHGAASASTTSDRSRADGETSGSVDGQEPDLEALALARCADIAMITTDVLGDGSGSIDPVLHGVLLTYAAEHDDRFGGLWIDREAFGTVVLAFTDEPDPHRAALAQRRPSTDDIPAVQPPPEITDDRPIGEWAVAFDVVQVTYTEAELITAGRAAMHAAQAATDGPVSTGTDVLRNVVQVETATPVTRAELTAIAESIDGAGGLDADMVCWEGELADEADDPIAPGTELEVIVPPDDEGAYPAATPVTCGGTPFEFGDLADPTPLAEVDPGLRAVVDNWIANPEGGFWPLEGWALLTERDGHATFVNVGDDGVAFIGAELGANGWIWSGASGGDCDIRLALPSGMGEVEWELDPDAPALDDSATQIRVLANERACASGQAMGDRLLGPQVVETDAEVLLAFAAITQAGEQDCQSNPSTAVTVELDAPLGDRTLRDGLTIGPISSLLTA